MNEFVLLGASIFVIVLAAIFVYLKLFTQQIKPRTANLIVGLPNSGKTTFFYKLKDDKVVNTHTSVKENTATFVPKINPEKKSAIELIDIPGHSRVRLQLINQYLPITKNVIYFLDASEFEAGPNAEFLYDLMTNYKFVEEFKPKQLFIALNKSDIALFVKNHIKRELEKELTTIHQTKQHLHQSLGDTSTGDETNKNLLLLDSQKEDFTFEKWSTLRGIPITIEFCSVVSGDGLDKIVKSVL
ncbi:hypothetical protein ABK040_001849 [Willaertia magna]